MNRLTELNGQYYWDGQPVSEAQAQRLWDSTPGDEQSQPGASALPYEPGGNVAVGAKNVALNAWDNLRQLTATEGEAAQIQRDMDIRNEQFQNLRNTDMGAGVDVGQGLAYAAPAMLTRGYGSEALMGGASAYLGQNNPTWLDAALGSGSAFGSRFLADQIIGRISNALTGVKPTMTDQARRLEEGGYQLTPGQQAGSQKALKGERRFETNPFVDTPANYDVANEELLLRRANQAIGAGDVPTPLNRAHRTAQAKRIGDAMTDAVGDAELTIPETLAGRVQRIIKNDDMLELEAIPAGGSLTGKQYKTLRSDLRRARDSSEGSTRDYIKKTIDQLDDEFEAVVPAENVQAYRVAREQYKNLSTLEEGRALTSAGEINVPTAQSRMSAGYGKRGIDNALPETQALINDLDDLGGRGMVAYMGNSGTPEGLRGVLNPMNLLEAGVANTYYNNPGLLAARDPLFGHLGGAGGMAAGGLLDPLELTSR